MLQTIYQLNCYSYLQDITLTINNLKLSASENGQDGDHSLCMHTQYFLMFYALCHHNRRLILCKVAYVCLRFLRIPRMCNWNREKLAKQI